MRKLWSKMADREWRVSAKALYIVHRFAADGSIEHATNLKESVAVLRTHHDSRRKVRGVDEKRQMRMENARGLRG